MVFLARSSPLGKTGTQQSLVSIPLILRIN